MTDNPTPVARRDETAPPSALKKPSAPSDNQAALFFYWDELRISPWSASPPGVNDTINHTETHDRRKIIHVNVTDSPSSAWTGRQLREAFPFDTAPRYLLRDNDTKFLGEFTECVEALGIEQVTTTPRSPWQNAYANG